MNVEILPEYFLTYTPELNPVEQQWRIIKARTAGRIHGTTEEVKAVLRRMLDTEEIKTAKMYDYLMPWLCREEYVKYHNNTSERLRMFALMRKVSYGSRSERGMQTTEIMATVCATCELRGINPHEFIRDYLDGKVDDIPMPKASVAVCA